MSDRAKTRPFITGYLLGAEDVDAVMALLDGIESLEFAGLPRKTGIEDMLSMVETTKAFADEIASGKQPPYEHPGPCIVLFRNNEGDLVGLGELRKSATTYSIGIATSASHRQQGYGREMMFQLTESVFDELDAKKSSVRATNAASVKIIESLGYSLKSTGYDRGSIIHSYTMTAEEWKARNAPFPPTPQTPPPAPGVA